MANLKEIKKRIGSTQSMRQVTRTMEMVSTAKIRLAQQRVEHARPYAVALEKILSRVTQVSKDESHPLLAVHGEKKRVMIISIASDRGQAGAFNSNVIALTEAQMAAAAEAEATVELVCIGRKTAAYFRYRNIEPDLALEGSSGQPSYEESKELADRIIAEYSDAVIDEVQLIYNRFVNVAVQRAEVSALLPIGSGSSPKPDATPETDASGAEVDYLFEPSAQQVLATLLPSYIEALVYQALLESAASEHGARRTAMKAATDNAETMIHNLTRSYNRARQAAITTEIAEIVGGAAALEG
ncbi:MAG: ATP synthase F1 subunit gamma [Actinomycetes bacterium]|jgi:F-type H+-transporting ATPase subunit gamma|nr:ATP synthase F1 subunit gamma [Actinomycetes bacterium]